MRDPHPLPGSDCVVADRRVHLVRHGRASTNASPLLLLHGLPTSSYLWRDVMRDLEHDVPTLAPDLLGLGHSERPRVAGYDLLAQARLLLGLLDTLGLARVVLVGHALGGAVAVHMAALAPERVTGLALLGTPVHPDTWPKPAVLPLTLPGVGRAYASLAGRALLRRLLTGELGAAGVLPPEVTRRYASSLLTPDGARGLVRFVRSVDHGTTLAAWNRLRETPPPTLLLWGTEDRVHSIAYGRRLAEELPSANWVPLAGRGHLLPEECPERIAEELAGFCAELAAPVDQAPAR
jgi:2-hydroxymuconate-semialdehyde hydrolase